jgi:hypothetical protein
MNISWKLGVNGDFATASNWDLAVVPGPADDAIIAVPGAYTVTSSISETVDSLSILDSAATLLINGNSGFLAVNGVNDGTIIVDGSGFTFRGHHGQGSFENSGTLEATNGGSLVFDDETITNTPQGVIDANGANTRVVLGAFGLVTIVGGTLEAQGANAVIVMGSGSGSIVGGTISSGTVLDGSQPGNPVNIEGNVVSTEEAAIGLIGTINNSGVITMRGGDFPWLLCEGNVTLEGGGDITMTNPSTFPVELAPSIFGGVLTNVDNTISGTGTIGQIEPQANIVGTFINEANGTINANANGPLVIAGVGPDSNAGLMEATHGGTMLIDGVTIDNFLNTTNGTIEAGQNSIVGLENASIVGGLVIALSGSIVESVQGSNTITGANVTNFGTIGAQGANLTITGNVNNHGNLDANNATLLVNGNVNGGTATIEGTGEIEFNGRSAANVTFAANSDAILKLDQPSTFSGTVSGLTTGDYIDLTNINFADNPTLSYSSKSQVLKVVDSVSHITDTIKFIGPVGSFSAQSDGSGGTLIGDPPPANVVTISHHQDSFVFAPMHGESLTANAHDETIIPVSPHFTDVVRLLGEAHQDGVHAMTNDAIDIHALATHQAHDFLL